MKFLKLTISFLLIFIFSYGVSTAQETTLFAASADTCDNPAPATDSTLYIVNPNTAASTLVGPIGFQGVTGLAFLGDGRLVASAQADVGDVMNAIFIEINPLTGQGSLIGPIGDDETPGECGRAPDLTYDPATDTLFAIGRRCVDFDNNDSVLMEINQITGLGSIIGNIDDGGAGNGLAIRADGTLFWATNVQGPDGARLFTINPATGQATQVTAFSQEFPNLGAFAFHPVTQVLFASSLNPLAPLSFPNASLETVNTTTGLLTLVGQLPDCTDAIVFSQQTPSNVPTLSEWGLIALAGILGIVGFMVMRRRKVAA
ncbi:MAG: hypothetical protein DHS20C13_16370 [Thermodesulfobacteriota bacterium]|nr:MAG: hypothetical protein DHS20C13_16370 [Thermodesulfobacteriota bacterium]